MGRARASAACTAFDGKMVVAGGMDENLTKMKTVEYYDVTADEWSSMASMNDGKGNHRLVAVKDKLFAIGYADDACEVFSKASNEFSYIKQLERGFWSLRHAVPIGSKIYVFQSNQVVLDCYDIERDE